MTPFQCKCKFNSKQTLSIGFTAKKKNLTKPNLDDFFCKLFEQYRIETCGKQYEICVATNRFFILLSK